MTTSSAKRTLRLDTKGRLPLAEVTKGLNINGLSGFQATVDANKRIILEPVVEMPASAADEFTTPLSLRDARRFVEILNADVEPNDRMTAAAARFKAWDERG